MVSITMVWDIFLKLFLETTKISRLTNENNIVRSLVSRGYDIVIMKISKMVDNSLVIENRLRLVIY